MVLGIYGAGGLGRGLYELITRNQDGLEKWQDYFFIDDIAEEGELYGRKRIHFDSIGSIYDKAACEILIAVGEPMNRTGLYEKVKHSGYKLATYIDETAIVSKNAKIGEGSILYPYVHIDVNVQIGENCLIEGQSIVGHGVTVGKNTVISSGSIIGGESSVGEVAYLGLMTLVKDRITIGNHVIAAMGSAIFRDVADNTTVVGNPARVTKGNESRRVWN